MFKSHRYELLHPRIWVVPWLHDVKGGGGGLKKHNYHSAGMELIKSWLTIET